MQGLGPSPSRGAGGWYISSAYQCLHLLVKDKSIPCYSVRGVLYSLSQEISMALTREIRDIEMLEMNRFINE